MGFVAAKCPECGADIQVPKERDVAKCMYCGQDIVVRQAVGDTGRANVANWLNLADAAAESGNHEEAYSYFTKVLEVEPENYRAWFGKAIAAGWDSRLARDRFAEVLSGVDRALGLVPDNLREPFTELAASSMASVATAYFWRSREHTMQYIALDDTWEEHVERCEAVLAVLKFAVSLHANSRVIEGGIDIAKSVIEGIRYDDPYDTYDNGIQKTKVRNLPPSVEAEFLATMNDLVNRMRAINPGYQTPVIKKASAFSPVLAFFGAGALMIVGYAVWWIMK